MVDVAEMHNHLDTICTLYIYIVSYIYNIYTFAYITMIVPTNIGISAKLNRSMNVNGNTSISTYKITKICSSIHIYINNC